MDEKTDFDDTFERIRLLDETLERAFQNVNNNILNLKRLREITRGSLLFSLFYYIVTTLLTKVRSIVYNKLIIITKRRRRSRRFRF